MSFDWGTIKQHLELYCKNAFEEINFPMTEAEISENLTVFHNLINMKCGYALLSSYGHDVRDALQKCCITEIGSSNQLKVFLTSIDSFLKRIILFTGIDNYNNIDRKKLMGLVKILPIYSTIPNLEITPFENFKNDGSGLYAFAMTWKARNQETHNSPNWDVSTVTTYFKFSISFIVIVIAKLKPLLLSHFPDITATPILLETIESKEEFRAYDFINFGKTSNEIRNEIIDCYLLHYIKENISVNQNELIPKVQKFIGHLDTKISVKTAIRRLISKNKLKYDSNQNIILTDNERARLEENSRNYLENIHLFNDSLGDILKEYGIEKNLVEIKNAFSEFLDENFSLILGDAIVPPTALPSTNSVVNLFTVLRKFIHEEEKINKLYEQLINLCRNNDILVRLSLGKAYGTLTNPERFSQYVKNQERIVYLDTHFLLYLICLNEDLAIGENWIFKIAKTLYELSLSQKGLILKFGSQYLGEVVYHLKNALKLIHLEEFPHFKTGIPTNNVFYQHYLSLYKENLLPDDIKNFADYIEVQFAMKEEDLEDIHFKQIAQKNIVDKLLDLNITIEDIPHYTEEEISASRDLFNEALKITNTEKSFHVLNNDIIMGHFLFQECQTYEPFFLTQDNSFSIFRKLYIEKFLRKSFWAWHLFTPSKFVNHLELLEFKIDIDAISEDLLSLIESDSFKNKSRTFVDINNKLIDINGLTGTKRREYSKLNFELLKGFEFSNLNDELTNPSAIPNRIGEIWDDVRSFVSDLGPINENNFYKNLLDSANYEFMITNIQNYLQDVLNDKNELMKNIKVIVFKNEDKKEDNNPQSIK